MADDVRQAAPQKRQANKPNPMLQYERTLRGLRMITMVSLVIGVMGIAFALISLSVSFKALSTGGTVSVYTSANTSELPSYNLTSPLIVPNASDPDFPVITTNSPFGSRLTGINQPLNATQLAVINGAPDAYFEEAGEMLLNGTLNDSIGVSSSSLRSVPKFIVNGKPSVIYLGSITCIFCGENRWAMALALSRFGSFGALYQGYSSLGDSDVPTLYWAPAHYSVGSFDFGSFYNSSYLNFIAMENTDPITQGFDLQPTSVMQQEVNATGNTAYKDAFQYILTLNDFGGTPYTIWGNYRVNGADGIVFGNSTPTTDTIPLEYMTHAQVFSQLSSFNDQFAWGEYAAADVYISMMCKSINNTAPICSIPVISKIEQATGY